MLMLTRKLSNTFDRENCIAVELPTGEIVRLWVLPSNRGRGRVLTAIDAPPSVLIRRGELDTPEVEGPPDAA